MNKEGLWTHENLDSIEENDGLLIVTDSGGNFIDPEIVREYIGSSTDPDALGVPVPTAADAGKVLAVNEAGNGFILKVMENSVLLWENLNPNASFRKQTIPCDTDYSMFAIFYTFDALQSSDYIRNDIVFVPKNAGEIRMPAILVRANGTYFSEWRNVYADDRGITFSDGGGFSVAANGEYGDSRACVPLKIYGIK